jgi:hypothetical protein
LPGLRLLTRYDAHQQSQVAWPVYLATARRVSKCPAAVLVVLCPDLAEAEKCRQPIRTGHPGFDLVPIVVDSGGPPGQASPKAKPGERLGEKPRPFSGS